MRIGTILLQHESNTFIQDPTTIEDFQADTLLTGRAMQERFLDSHHEGGGFFAGLAKASAAHHESIDAVPIFAAKALPKGAVTSATFDELMARLFEQLDAVGELDGILAGPHGALVAESQPDGDGYWLRELRQRVGPAIPIISTIDPHANLSRAMVENCDAAIAYRSNPHLDQRARGLEAAGLMVSTLKGDVRPTMAAAMPPLAINIERQMTTEAHLRPLYDLANQQLTLPGVLSNSVVLGFPYADVEEMGSAVISITDNDQQNAQQTVNQLADYLWLQREDFRGQMISVDAALTHCASLQGPICLLDMGDNVGGGSAADGTFLLQAIHERQLSRAFVCIFDPEAVAAAERGGIGATLRMTIGGKTDDQHGPSLTASFVVRSFSEGKFSESEVRHGGMKKFDQGRTAIVETEHGMTVMLTSRRMIPFSLEQLRSCGLAPTSFHVLVAKGVNAPVAAYREVCPHLIRVDTSGSTRADMTQLEFKQRRHPMFPFEEMQGDAFENA